MTIINTSPNKLIQIGYEGEDKVTILRFSYSDKWLENGDGIFTIRVLRNGENQAYNAQLIEDDRENCTIDMTLTDVELSIQGYGEMQLVYTGANFVKKSLVYKYYVSRSVDDAVDPPAQDVYTQIIESLSDLQMDVQGLTDAVEDIGDISLLTTTAKTDLVSAINEINEHSGGGGGSVTVDSELSTTSTNPVQNKVLTARINGLDSDVGALRTSVQSKADIQTVSALADAVQGLDGDVQGLQTSKADKSYVDTQLSEKASTQTVSDLADDVSDLQTGLASKVGDVQINGSSVVSGGVAEIPIAKTTDVGLIKVGSYGVGVNTDGGIYINGASSAAAKAGVNTYNPVVPVRQHESAFYGLAKVAGHDEKNSALPVGTYTDEAKVAIQKMLGIYEAPWELIREDTFTNAEEADHIITTDANGNAFELTDLIILFETPKQATGATKGYYGHIWCYYGNGDSQYMSLECGAWGQNANEAYHACGGMIENKGGLMVSTIIQSSTGGARTSVCQRLITGFSQESPMSFISSSRTFTKINIRAVTGTGHYKLYGKRKWQ